MESLTSILQGVDSNYYTDIFYLGAKGVFLAKLVPTVVQLMGDTFPELVEMQDRITATINEEEGSFQGTLKNKGKKHFDKLADKVGNDGVLSGVDVFKLHSRTAFQFI